MLQICYSVVSSQYQKEIAVPTPRVPTNIANTSASRAFCTTAYRLMSSLLLRTDSSLAILTFGSYEYTYITRIRGHI